MHSIKEVRDDFLSESHEDFVGLWSLIWRIKNEMGATDPKSVRAHSMEILRELLSEGLIKAGMPNEEGELAEWQENSEQIVKRIEGEWDQLGREPDIGDIVWFTTTEKGNTHIEQRF